ncbi:hypothetical protein TUM16657_23430 [Enterobacter cloacae]|nr:hypothetical protein EBZU44_00270 [Enterobacter cloacae]GJJ92586.1 hypothetical protein TUM16654_08660 [Enterobacter cloacae]GJK09749.1 hypothetical protein TUM16657_23430 [Enterobacter cloacae]
MFLNVAKLGIDNKMTIKEIAIFLFAEKAKALLEMTMDINTNVGTMYLIEKRFVGLSLSK